MGFLHNGARGESTAEAGKGWQNMNQREVQAGQLYRSMEIGLFGGPGREWKVISLARRNDGVMYATLTMTHDPSEHKTLAMNVLQDRRMYRLVADTRSDEPTIAPEP